MNYNEIIEEFDEKISNYIERLATTIKVVSFIPEESVCFVVSKDFDSKSLFPYKKQQGVYLFELNLDSPKLVGKKRETRIKNFAEEWSKKKNDSFFSSSVIKKRLKLHEKYDEQWLPLYIGKNKDIYKRIVEHIDLPADKNTYAMKLKNRPNIDGLEFRVSVIEFNVKNYDFIVPHVERSMREKYNPLIGKQ